MAEVFEKALFKTPEERRIRGYGTMVSLLFQTRKAGGRL